MILNERLFESVKNNINEDISNPGVAFSAYITNLGKYNESDLVGEWVDFPIDEDEFAEVLTRIGISDEPDEDGNYYEEWFVTDYSSNVFDIYDELGEYPSYDELNELAEVLVGLDEYDREVLEAIVEVKNIDLLDAIDKISDAFYISGIKDDGDLGYYMVELDGNTISKDLAEQYVDYEQLGRDLSFDEYVDGEGNDITAGEYYCGDENATDEEIGYAYIDAVGLDNISNLDQYFDYDAYGRDIAFDGSFTKYGFLFD